MEEIKEVKRKAKVGEWVKVVNPCDCDIDKYKKDDVMMVTNVLPGNIVSNTNGINNLLYHHEYVVLEGYKNV